jgi:hypothetical protein
MKKIICLFIILSVLKAEAQQSALFKMKYLPNRNYDLATNMTMDFNVDLSGNEDIIEKLKSQGISPPIVANMTMSINGHTQTGAAGKNNIFPMTTSIKVDQIKVKIGANEIPIYAGKR